ncbi:hypothetical protein A2U01_0050260, partial [Trifolium medium]|nr:hypothetical protein [Trifolium medium]
GNVEQMNSFEDSLKISIRFPYVEHKNASEDSFRIFVSRKDV